MTRSVGNAFPQGSARLFLAGVFSPNSDQELPCDELPRITITNSASERALEVTLDVHAAKLHADSDLVQFGSERHEAIFASAGEDFKLEVEFKPGKFRFGVRLNGQHVMNYDLPSSVGLIEFGSVTIDGNETTEVDFVGFLTEGKHNICICRSDELL